MEWPRPVLVVAVAKRPHYHWNQSIRPPCPLRVETLEMSIFRIGNDWIVPLVVSDTVCSMDVEIGWNRGAACPICRLVRTHRIRSLPPRSPRQPICTMVCYLKIQITMMLWDNYRHCKCRRHSVTMIKELVVPYHPKYQYLRIVIDWDRSHLWETYQYQI